MLECGRVNQIPVKVSRKVGAVCGINERNFQCK